MLLQLAIIGDSKESILKVLLQGPERHSIFTWSFENIKWKLQQNSNHSKEKLQVTGCILCRIEFWEDRLLRSEIPLIYNLCGNCLKFELIKKTDKSGYPPSVQFFQMMLMWKWDCWSIVTFLTWMEATHQGGRHSQLSETSWLLQTEEQYPRGDSQWWVG